MVEKFYKNALSLRGDSHYCPLALSLDAYWNCLVNCHHCFFRGLNHTWGTDLRPANPEEVQRKLINGLENKTPRSPLAYALAQKKTIRLGSKSDPFQPAESVHHVASRLLEILKELDWSVVIQTRFPTRMVESCSRTIMSYNWKNLILMPVISPGWEKDWSIFEREKTEHPDSRLKTIKTLHYLGIPAGVNGEPFIPGFHTLQDFRDTLRRLKDAGIFRYNTYNFHFTPYVAKKLAENTDVDIEKIWEYNQDSKWKDIQARLIDEARRLNMILGCPDFVNSGNYYQKCNTCCGVDVPNPMTWNTHNWKRWLQEGFTIEEVIDNTWDGVGDKELGIKILTEKSDKFYSISDVGLEVKKKEGILW